MTFIKLRRTSPSAHLGDLVRRLGRGPSGHALVSSLDLLGMPPVMSAGV